MDWTAGDFPPVRLIEHSDGKEFGTGFAVLCDENATWLVTCAHVVDTRGKATLRVGTLQAEVVVDGRAEGCDSKIDLAVLRVPDLKVAEVLRLAEVANLHQGCRIPGWCELVKGTYRSDCLHAAIGNGFQWTEKDSRLVAQAFDLSIERGGHLDKGYSGAPAISLETGAVFAVVATYKEPGKSGSAICISHLLDIWPDMPAELLAALEPSDLGAQFDQEIRTIFAAFSAAVSTQDIRAVCSRSIPPELRLSLPVVDALDGYCTWLLDRRQFDKNRRHPLYDVLAYLKSRAGAQEEMASRIARAMQRLERHYPGLVSDPLPAAEPVTTTEPALVEIVFEPRGAAEIAAYDVHSFWHPPGGEGTKAGLRREHVDGGRLDLESEAQVADFSFELRQALDSWAVDAGEILLLFRLPNELLLHPFDHWPQDEFGIPLGRDYPVILGLRERPQRASKQAWEQLKTHLGDCLREHSWCADAEVNPLDRVGIGQILARIDESPCPVLPRVPKISESKAITLLSLLVQRGVPVALWPRCEEAESHFCAVLEESLGHQPIALLPFAVRDLRKRGFAAVAPTPAHEHLALLWDDPNRSVARARSGRFFPGVG